MNDILKIAMRVTLLFTAVCLFVWAVLPEWRTLSAGVMLGVAASAFNAFLLRRRIELLGNKTLEGGNGKMGMGLAGRLATVLFAVMTAYRFPDTFLLPATLVACFFVQIVAPFAAVYVNKRQIR